MNCEECMYGNPYDVNELSKLGQLIEMYEEHIREMEKYNEDNQKRSFLQRGPFQPIAHELAMLDQFNADVDRIMNHVRCQRYPEFVKRHKKDICGEFARD